jgi:peptidoglycan/LPS O-acetylase OafA/YrhL
LLLILSCLLLTGGWYFFLNGYLRTRLEGPIVPFLMSMKFHSMSIGALFAYVLHYRFDWYQRSFLSRPVAQLLAFAFVVYQYVFGFEGGSVAGVPLLSDAVGRIALSFAYGCIFVNCSSLPRPVVNLEWRPLRYLGEISYGIYMYHSFVAYGTRFVVMQFCDKSHWLLIFCIHSLVLLGLTILVSALSYRYFERFFLNLRSLYPRSRAEKIGVDETACDAHDSRHGLAHGQTQGPSRRAA